ncbi:MAG TPA: hypothetical protein VFQ82_06900 [Stellaceae bacterium]|nr:hypothetical protein [Stellaceae bacterium]
MKDLVEEALRRSLAGAAPETAARPASEPSFDELMQDCRGIASDVPPDFATNPKFLEGFGR